MAKGKKVITPYLYLLPTIVLMCILLIIPIVMVISYSFYDNVIINKNPVFVGLKNYATVLTDPTFLVAIKNTLLFVLISIVAHFLIGMLFAMLLNTRYLGITAKGIFRVIYALPWMFTASVIAIVWRMMLNPNGVLNFLMMNAGIISEKVEWLASRDVALSAVTVINIWSGYPFYMISILAGLQGISMVIPFFLKKISCCTLFDCTVNSKTVLFTGEKKPTWFLIVVCLSH